ncbi:hypothetical protein [Oceanicella actignis]|nr:hypothetical protein [Oceanicella actignis]
MPSTELLAQTASAVGNSNPAIAINLSPLNDWSVEMPFLDLMKNARPFWANQSGQWSSMSHEQLESSGYLDENGWPTAIPAGMEGINAFWDWSQPEAAATRAGTYVITYKGEGQITVPFGGTIVSSEPGRIVFENPNGGPFMLRIVSTDPNGTGEYLRDISVVKAEHEELHEAGAIFNPEFLEVVSDFRQFRFMDWMETNNSVVADWSERTTFEDAHWTGEQGPPVEVMVRLANEAGVDPWFNIPHQASDEYVRQFATYVRNNLDPALKATIEYSNETWNAAFQQYHWLDSRSQAEWGRSAPFDYYVKRATEVAKIFDEVFGQQADDRLVQTLGAHNGNTWLTGYLLDAPIWRQADPSGYVAPAQTFDAVAVTTYFGGATSTDAALTQDLLNAINDPNVNAFDYLAQKLLDPDYPLSIPFFEGLLREHKAIAEAAGLRLTAYEGGQHVHHLFATDGAGEQLTDFMIEFVRSPQMAQLYEASIESWKTIGDGAYMQFGDVQTPNKWGSWGFLSSLDDSTPRGDVIYAANAETPWWEDRGGVHFQNGVIREGGAGDDALTGTVQEDYLIGGAGNDVLVGGAGDDGLNGGEGTDTAVFSGAASDYVVHLEDGGVRLVGPDGSDFLRDVEFVEFENGGVVSMADLTDGAVPAPTDPAPAPVDPTPTDPTPTDPTPTDPTPTDPTPTDPTPTDPTPTDPTPTDPTPTDPTPAPGGQSLSDDVLMIGHSLIGTTLPLMLRDLVDDAPSGGRIDAQVINGAPLSWQWDHSSEAQGVDGRAALATGAYEAVVLTEAVPLQNHLTWSDTYGYAKRFYDLAVGANPEARVYMYETWHDIRSGTGVDVPYDEGDSVPWRERLAQDLPKWQGIVDHVNANRAPGQPEMQLIPAGQAMARMHDTIAAGQVPGLNDISDLFADTIHLNDLGNYFMAMVHYAAIYGRDPGDLPEALHGDWGQAFGAPSAALADVMQDIAWQTVSETLALDPADPADPAPIDPTPTDPAPSDPAPSDPAPSDPTPSDPTPSDPTPTDPAPTDPEPADPPAVDPADPSAEAAILDISIPGAFVSDAAAVRVNGVDGIQVNAVNVWSTLGRELNLASDASARAYVLHANGAQATFDGVTVDAGYFSLEENVAAPGGAPLADTALDAALAFGGVVVNAGRIVGTAGADDFRGRDGDDVFDGADGDDVLVGGAGDDVLIGGKGADWISGGEGEDVAVFSGQARDYAAVTEGGGVRVTGADGSDFLSEVEFVQFSDGVRISIEDLLAGNLPDGGGAQPDAGSGDGSGDGSAPTGGSGSSGGSDGGSGAPTVPEAVVDLSVPGQIVEGAAKVNISGTTGGVKVQMVGGGSKLGQELGLSMDNTHTTYTVWQIGYTREVNGVDVKASYWSAHANLSMKGGFQLADTALEASQMFSSLLVDVGEIRGTAYGDTFSGSHGGDVIDGAGGRDRIDGRRGDDILFGNNGRDILTGGEGADVFVFEAGDGKDKITDFSHEDILDLTAYGFADRAEALSSFVLQADGDLVLTPTLTDSIELVGLREADLAWINVLV